MWQQLLLMATLLLAPCPVNSIKELPGVQNYEVVYPKRLHPRHKREVKDPGQQENFETELKYEMTVNGKIAVLYLKKNKNLLAPGYTETYYNSSGKAVTTSPQIMDNCYYQGHIVNEKVSDASISTCRGLRGYFSQGDQKYFIEPLSLTNQDEQEHALFKHDPEEQKTKSSCGMNDTIWAPGIHLKALSSTSLATSKDQKFWEKKKYVEYYLVLDHGEFKRHNQDQEEIRKTVFEMVNYINMLYKKLNTYVALIGMEIWNDKDKIDISSNAKLTLENFSKWRTGVLLKRKHHDVAQLLTTVAFSGTTVGLAYISTMCSPDFSAGIIKDHSNNALQVAGTMAHEMGHNFGMFHDNYDCKCPSIECVMDGSLSINIPTDFSSCSRASFEKFFEDKLSNCLFNVPLPTDIISTPICGNQLVEMGEDCDCGTPEECTNICCDAKTCKMKENVQCALGECCEKCQLKKAGEVCRPAKDECDLPEMCDGKSTLCPSDRYQINGFPCQNGKGYCRMGTCPTLEKQCTDLWGPGAQVADKSCFRRNEDGSTYGYCRKVNNTHIPCKAKDATCGKLFCNGGSDYLPWKGRIVTILTCRLFDPEDSSEEIGMVINGTKCGDKKVCINAECVDMERTYKSANCSSKCKGQAVCDHELKCQCKEGWAPPDCSDSSTIFNFSIVVGVLLPVAVIFVMVAIVIRCRSSREKQKLVQRPLSTTDAGLHNQKRKPQMAKTVQPQELPTNPSFPPPLISTSVSSSFLRSRGKIKLDSEGGEIKLDNWSDHNFVLSRTSQLPAVASMSLVLLSILCLIIQTQAITIRQTLESELYEVVHPKKLHILHKREIQNNQKEKHGKEERYEPELQYQMMLNGEEVILSLQKAEHLLGPDYTETYYSPGGEEITTRPQNMEHCYYKGHILNEKDSVASISTCDGLRGYFTHHNQRYMIKPLKSTGREEHAILRYNQEELNPANHTCGVRNVGRKQDLIRTSRSLRSPEIEEFLQGEKYIDLLLVLDNAFYKMYNENITVIRSFVFDVINLLNVIYNTIDIQVSLVGMEIWSNSDKIKVVPSTTVTFKNFLNWHYSNLGKMKTHDHAQLLSGVGFKTRMAGLATSNSLCSPSSVAVIEGKRKNSVSLVGVMSHELGHVLGMPDVPYNTKCPSGSCVMNKYLSSKFPKDFSTVSRSHFKKYMLSQKPRCLLQALVPKNMTKPVCGNQLVEVGEDCDCGSPEECTNPCCEAMTCMLKHEVDCGKETEQ